MLHDRIREQVNKDASEELDAGGYLNVDRGVFVPENGAFDYAIEQCVESGSLRDIKWTSEFMDMLIEWFYSSSEWIEEK